MRTGLWKLGSTRSRQIRVESSGGFPGSRCRMSETETLDWGADFNMETKRSRSLEHRKGLGTKRAANGEQGRPQATLARDECNAGTEYGVQDPGKAPPS